jgi:hypothetical protein
MDFLQFNRGHKISENAITAKPISKSFSKGKNLKYVKKM